MSFIDGHRKELGIEPICRELAIAPSSYHTHAARLAQRIDIAIDRAMTSRG